MKLKFDASVIRKTSASIFNSLYFAVNQTYTNSLLKTRQGHLFMYILCFFPRACLPSVCRKNSKLHTLFFSEAEGALVESSWFYKFTINFDLNKFHLPHIRL